MTKDDMLPIQVWNVLRGDEKLTSIGTWTGIGHTELTCLGMFDHEIFIGKFFTENRFSSCTISSGKVTTLNHKILDDTMEGTIFVMQGCTLGPCSLFSRTKSSEIFSCLRNNILVQLHHNPSKIFLTVLDIKKDMWIITILPRSSSPCWISKKTCGLSQSFQDLPHRVGYQKRHVDYHNPSKIFLTVLDIKKDMW
eukprot:CAMPEP_0195329772 /NCGR_PEP_ID=MMETSP0708-20121125/11644_1 /TAXON_ID=33640 /ORGANISM="Asterionellopsis glacialis, Strain CCMP134" /LENGTH=194 /DNA_ID=CAMNT_0040397929 /DNA_START=111 /DNA_END=692 /DNA_ORIENTATION=+